MSFRYPIQYYKIGIRPQLVGVIDLDALFDGGSLQADLLAGKIEVDTKVAGVIGSSSDIKLSTDKKIVTINFTTSSGQPGQTNYTVKEGETAVVIQDSKNNYYAVNTATGDVTYLGQKNQDMTQILASFDPEKYDVDNMVTFSQGTDTWAFDEGGPAPYFTCGSYGQEYRNLEPLDGTGDAYYVPWKFVPTGNTGKVKVTLTGADKDLTHYMFVTRFGVELTLDASTSELTLPPGMEGADEELYALHKGPGNTNTQAGQLRIRTESPKEYNVTLVAVGPEVEIPVAGDLKTQLDDMFSPYAISWNVDVKADRLLDDSWDKEPKDKTITAGDEFLSYYSDEQNALHSLFKSQYGVEAGRSVMFLIKDEPTNTTEGKTGDMPISRKWGYLFGSSIDYRTIAHELGHGRLGLSHTFTECSSDTKGKTQNLMDYYDPATVTQPLPTGIQAGCELNRFQWETAHNPPPAGGIFQSDEDAAVWADTYYWTPAGTPIYIKNTGTTILDIAKIKSNEHINGILYSWKDGYKKYVADIRGNMFFGYIEFNTSDIYIDVTKLMKGRTISVNSIMYLGNCTKGDIITQYELLEDIDGSIYYVGGKSLIPTFSYTDGEKKNLVYITKNCPDTEFTGKAKDFISYCTGKFTDTQQPNIVKTAGQIQTMGTFYDDYEKIVLATNPYATWVNTPANLDAFYAALIKYYDEHKNAPLVDNPNCSTCPKNPIVGDSYWDEAGRNWVFVEGNKWKDLSGEFCEEAGCNNDWKQGLSTEEIQKIHNTFYNEELALRQNHPWQAGLGGTPTEFREYLKRLTQIATVVYLKKLWIDEKLGAEKWIPIWGNMKESALNIDVANGDMTFYTRAGGSFVLAAVDFAIIKGVVQRLVAEGVITIAKNAVIEELSLLNTYFSQPKVIITFAGITVLNIGAQFAGNCYVDGSISLDAFLRVDYWDAVLDGEIAIVTMSGSLLYQLFTKSEKVYLYDKLGKVIFLEFLKAEIDITPQEGIVIRDFFNNDLDAWNTFALFTISMATDQIPVNEIAESFVIWSKTYVNTFANGLSVTAKPVFDQMNSIIKTEGFQLLCNQPKDVIEQIISQIIESHFKSIRNEGVKSQIKKSGTISTEKTFNDFIIENEKLPSGSPIPESLIINIE